MRWRSPAASGHRVVGEAGGDDVAEHGLEARGQVAAADVLHVAALAQRSDDRGDAAGGHVESDPVTVGDLHATVAHACGLPIETPVISPSGRPFMVGNKGKPVGGVFV